MDLKHFKNLQLLDVHTGTLKPGHEVLVRDEIIAQVAAGPIQAPEAEVFDLGGRTLMPGLIDCHVHVCAEGMRAYPTLPRSLVTAIAFKELEDTLMRGFTTARDAGGADLGIKMAIERGLVTGPRLFVSGYPISQTGGHGDGRSQGDCCQMTECQQLSTYKHIADGVDAVRKAAREEIRKGADQVKIMASGGVASPSDPIDRLQYADDELRAVVDEARRANTYVMAHVYTDIAIRRVVEAGIRSIEHGNLLGDETAGRMADKDAFLVPTLIVYRIITEHGRDLGVSDLHLSKAKQILETGTRSIEIAKTAGVKMAYGTDLFRAPSDHECEEFLVRSEVLSAAEIIRSATVIGAELIRMENRLGVIAPDAYADLLVVDGNPLEDLGLLQDQGRHLPAIIKGGVFVKNRLSPPGPND